jgi:glutathionyl-hydroquinone reductase
MLWDTVNKAVVNNESADIIGEIEHFSFVANVV